MGQTLSPFIHNTAFAAQGINFAFAAFPVPPERIGDGVRGLAALHFAGAGVTIPHKQAVLPYLDELSPRARAVGASNMIVHRPDGTLFGDNTDVTGFLAPLLSPDGSASGRRYGCAGRRRRGAGCRLRVARYVSSKASYAHCPDPFEGRHTGNRPDCVRTSTTRLEYMPFRLPGPRCAVRGLW